MFIHFKTKPVAYLNLFISVCTGIYICLIMLLSPNVSEM